MVGEPSTLTYIANGAIAYTLPASYGSYSITGYNADLNFSGASSGDYMYIINTRRRRVAR